LDLRGLLQRERRGGEGKGRGRKGPKGGKKNPPFKMSAYGPELAAISADNDHFVLV